MSMLDRIAITTNEIDDDFEVAIRHGLEWGIRNYELKNIYGKRIPDQTDEEMATVLSMRTASHGVDSVTVGSEGITIEGRRMRSHFALLFGDLRDESQREGARQEQVRTAFNSPFWPFVLASTSVGQEGLDFHPYCHAVVHWNLPSNPVDLEQREGRVHRYKGHAVRKNVARTHGDRLGSVGHGDLWARLFEIAAEETDDRYGGMVPYCVSKAAVNMLSRRLHFLLKDDGIPVLAVHPGWVKTDMGGPDAKITVETSVNGIVQVVDSYKDEDAPYQDYSGQPMSW